MHCWRKIVPPAQLDVWTEQLLAVVDPQRLAVVVPANQRTQRLEVYCDTVRQAQKLAAMFGGRVREISPQSWQPLPATAPGRPLSIGGRLLVTSRETEQEPLIRAHPDRCVLCIPAAMAFGTGEHATTAMCLRLLLAMTRQRVPDSWDLLDLGMGSGILALAGKQFGARSVLGLDNDPHAVRTARENAKHNGSRPARCSSNRPICHCGRRLAAKLGRSNRQSVQRTTHPLAPQGHHTRRCPRRRSDSIWRVSNPGRGSHVSRSSDWYDASHYEKSWPLARFPLPVPGSLLGLNTGHHD